MSNQRKLINKKDMLIILIILVIAILSYILYSIVNKTNNKTQAQILIDGKAEYTIQLDENKTFSIPEKPNIVFEIKDNKIRFLSSDCPDKVCVNSGFIGKNGQMAACLPNKTSIRIISDKSNDDTDIVI